MDNMELIICGILENLGISLTGLGVSEYVRLLLRYIPGVPRHLQLVFAALAESAHAYEFLRSKLLDGLHLIKEHPERLAAFIIFMNGSYTQLHFIVPISSLVSP